MSAALQLEPISIEGLRALYPIMEVDFPPDELKSLDKLERLMGQGISQGYWLTENGEPKGYAFLLRQPGEDMVLLDYYAIFAHLRGQSLGSQGLALLKAACPRGIFLEAEEPSAAATAQEREIRLRRVAFYQRAEFVPCPFENSVFGVRYLVHLWAESIPESRCRRAAQLLAGAYRCQLSESAYQRQVKITVPEKN
jgi:hypothetical protein